MGIHYYLVEMFHLSNNWTPTYLIEIRGTGKGETIRNLLYSKDTGINVRASTIVLIRCIKC